MELPHETQSASDGRFQRYFRRRRARLSQRCADLILDERAHPEQGFRARLGIIRLARSYGHERLDAAALRAIDIGARTYGSVKSILANNLDQRPSPRRSADDAPILHPNIRGPRYYN
jgi:transposase